MEEAKRCYFYESLHETANLLEGTKTSNERKSIIDLGVVCEVGVLVTAGT